MDEEIRQIDPDMLLQANKNYAKRIERDGANLIYDATLDTVFVEFGGPKEALSEHVTDNVMLRIDPETLEIVGFEILDFFSDFLPNNRLFREAVTGLGLEEGVDSEIALVEPLLHVFEAILPALAHSVGG